MAGEGNVRLQRGRESRTPRGGKLRQGGARFDFFRKSRTEQGRKHRFPHTARAVVKKPGKLWLEGANNANAF